MKKLLPNLLKCVLMLLSVCVIYSCESIGKLENPDTPGNNSNNNGSGTENPDTPDNPDKPKPPVNPTKWISEIVEYMPAPGQWTNSSSGNMEAAKKLVGGQSIVSLGGFGGYIVFRFNHDVENKKGYDFVIHGNSFPDQTLGHGFSSSEPGIVQVMFDENGDGIPNETWYDLKGDNHDDPDNIKNYEVTYTRPESMDGISDVHWSDNKGGSGYYDGEYLLGFNHWQCIYPTAEFFKDGNVPEKLTFKGMRIKDNGENVGMDGGEYWGLTALGKGYIDNYSDDYDEIVNNDPDTKASNKFDIDDAIDAGGNPVKLEKITFIRVYNPMNQFCGHLGETSPEICGAISLTAPAK